MDSYETEKSRIRSPVRGIGRDESEGSASNWADVDGEHEKESENASFGTRQGLLYQNRMGQKDKKTFVR